MWKEQQAERWNKAVWSRKEQTDRQHRENHLIKRQEVVPMKTQAVKVKPMSKRIRRVYKVVTLLLGVIIVVTAVLEEMTLVRQGKAE